MNNREKKCSKKDGSEARKRNVDEPAFYRQQQEQHSRISSDRVSQSVSPQRNLIGGTGGQVMLVPVFVPASSNALVGDALMNAAHMLLPRGASSFDIQQAQQRYRLNGVIKRREYELNLRNAATGKMVDASNESVGPNNHSNQTPKVSEPSTAGQNEQSNLPLTRSRLRPNNSLAERETSQKSTAPEPFESRSAASSSVSSAGSAHHSMKRKARGEDVGSTPKISRGRGNSRFLWSDELHVQFCSSIFQVGLRHASPCDVLEKINKSSALDKHPQIMLEHVTQHLEDYRKHLNSIFSSWPQDETSQEDNIMTAGDLAARLAYTCLEKAKNSSAVEKNSETNDEQQYPPDPINALHSAQIVDSCDPQWLKGFSHDPQWLKGFSHDPQWLKGFSKADRKILSDTEHDSLTLPCLHPKEILGPLGRAMGFLMGLIHSTNHQILQARLDNLKQKRVTNKQTHTLFVDDDHSVRDLTRAALLAGSELNVLLKISQDSPSESSTSP